MNDVQQRAAAKHFAEYWEGKGYEKGESQKFWLSLLSDVFGVEHAAEYIEFEDQVHLDHTSFIDGYIPDTHVLIEQKGIGKDLKKPIRQSDGSLLTPIQQAQRYASMLPYSQRPRWIIVCNFECFHIYDMEHPQSDPTEIWLKDLPTQYYLLEILVRKENISLQQEMEISIQAGEIVGRLYDAFLNEYKDRTNEHSLKSLNVLCVRLVFCLYAEDAGIFGKRLMFHDYLRRKGLSNARQALIELFRVLDTPVESRDPYMDDELAAFPYVNGGLFSDESIEIPRLNQTIFDLLLDKASAAFDWSEISPTIFGAVFESTLNPETRRKGGMHYTSIENIHKVIDPLFLDDLKAELNQIMSSAVLRSKEQSLKDYQKNLASLSFLDPACGSGNFLTESYIALRKLENQVIQALVALRPVKHKDEKSVGQIAFGGEAMGMENPIQVSIEQFFGIEINDFAVTVAKTALWIAESQMMKETEDIVHMSLDFLPLKTNAHVHEGNALRLDWESVVPKDKLNYIMGNPPFVGGMKMDEKQKEDMWNVIGKEINGVGEMDYVAAWYYKASKMIKGTMIECAFVSTNSIVQGQQAITVWEPLIKKDGIIINFAYRTFRWDSESNDIAIVHCVIIGFAVFGRNKRIIYNESGNGMLASNINSYLIDADNWFIHAISSPLCNVPPIRFGSMPRGKEFLMSGEEREEIIRDYPFVEKYIKKFNMGSEFIKGGERYCLWLVGANPSEIKKCPPIMGRIEAIRLSRLDSKASATRKLADSPMLFAQIAQPNSEYIAIPAVSTQRRKYIPMGFLPADTIAGNKLYIIPDATLYHFGILTSNVHMAWMRLFAGRMKSDYSYSKDIVYNNFPWPTPTEAQKARIEQTAQAILDARALYPNSSLADLYDELTMPPELRTAHQQNDRAVMEAYGMPVKTTTESSCVAELMRRYQALTAAEKK